MNRGRLIPASLLLLCLASFATAQDERNAPAETLHKTFQQARESQSGPPAVFEFELSDFAYRVSVNGNGARTREGKPTRGFNLRLEGGEEILRVLFAEYDGDLLLICEFKPGKVNIGGAAIFRLLQPSMRARWSQRIPSNGISAHREGSSLFMAGIGFIARLNLNSGQYDWQHANLVKREPGKFVYFGAFDEPEVSGGEILFREERYNENLVRTYDPNIAKTIVADKKTGEIIRIQ
ncbi:MAG TPA: hypothetical protein VLJ61_07770 [Pyrinomonadaceae bacterium]|nr:hypothetical protein [Pyrinomonadaceae bacterium]